mmetsp:Transcript_11911/g.35778  ORF Transcript_11911/g.35778 Transcript_11911/m.35778 type:complete len:232 (+) Transcript_11911:2288-2983(+)
MNSQSRPDTPAGQLTRPWTRLVSLARETGLGRKASMPARKASVTASWSALAEVPTRRRRRRKEQDLGEEAQDSARRSASHWRKWRMHSTPWSRGIMKSTRVISCSLRFISSRPFAPSVASSTATPRRSRRRLTSKRIGPESSTISAVSLCVLLLLLFPSSSSSSSRGGTTTTPTGLWSFVDEASSSESGSFPLRKAVDARLLRRSEVAGEAEEEEHVDEVRGDQVTAGDAG